MLQYKIDIISELAKNGINTTTAKKSGIFGQDTMRKFRNGDTKISLEVIYYNCPKGTRTITKRNMASKTLTGKGEKYGNDRQGNKGG